MVWSFMALGGVISLYLLISTAVDGYKIWGEDSIDFAVTGQFGDFIGGVAGTFFAVAGTFLIYLSFQAQIKQNERETFESAFFEMMKLHRENVNEMNYTKFEKEEEKLRTANNRKVFKLIFAEFVECYREVNKFTRFKSVDDCLLLNYKKKLEKIAKNINPEINVMEMAIIDISYSIVYYGVGSEGERILRHNFLEKYNGEFFYRLLRFIKLKPKRENVSRYEMWEKLRKEEYKKLTSLIEEIYQFRRHIKDTNTMSTQAFDLAKDDDYYKYYGGHQHRLGHYFRHLFQSYKYLDGSTYLCDEEKYFYGKMLRAQLSTYEQSLLFINSISSLGMRWEFTPEPKIVNLKNRKALKKTTNGVRLITDYNLIKNLPGTHFDLIRYKTYYPNVKYESDE